MSIFEVKKVLAGPMPVCSKLELAISKPNPNISPHIKNQIGNIIQLTRWVPKWVGLRGYQKSDGLNGY